MPAATPNTDRFLRRLARLEREVRHIATQPQLPYSSVEGGSIDWNSEDGIPTMSVGYQFDGTNAFATFNGPTPPTPSVPTAEGTYFAATVNWDGFFDPIDVLVPMDFARVEIHAVADPDDLADTADTLVGTYETPRGGSQVVPLAGPSYIKLVTRTTSGARSVASVPSAQVSPLDPPAVDTAAIQAELDDLNNVQLPALRSDLTDAQLQIGVIGDTTIPAIQADVADNTAALATAQGQIDTLNNTTIPGINSTLSTANSNITALQGRFPIQTVDLAALAVTTAKIADAAILTAKLGAGSVTNTVIADDSVTSAKIVANTIVAADIAATTITAAQIAATTITGDRLVANTITAAQIAANTITATQIAATTITGDRLVANTITAAQIAANTITAGQIAATTITGDRLVANTITATQIAANTITAAQIAADTITATQIAASAITASELAAGAVTANKLLVTVGGGNIITDSNMESTANTNGLWTANAGTTLSKDTTQKWQGTQALKVVATTENWGYYYPDGTGGKPLTISGQTYTASIYVYSGTAQSLMLTQYGTSPTNGPTVAVPANTWTRLFCTFVAPASNVFLSVRDPARTAVVGTIWLDGFQLEVGDVPTAYGPKPDEILPGTIVANMVSAGAITTASMTANTISGDRISTNSLNADRIVANSITAAKIAALTITANEIAVNTITATQIAGTTITASQIASRTISALQIATGAITANEIAAQTITASQIAAGTIDATRLTITDRTNLIRDPYMGNTGGWVFTANSSQWSWGTTATTQFYGDADNKVLRFTSASPGSLYTELQEGKIPVKPGDSYNMDVVVQRTSATADAGTTYVRFNWYDAGNGFLSTTDVTALGSSYTQNTWRTISNSATVPFGAAYMVPTIIFYQATTGVVYEIAMVNLYRKVTGTQLDPNMVLSSRIITSSSTANFSIPAPTPTFGATATTGGSWLIVGPWYYTMTAVNPRGETVRSVELSKTFSNLTSTQVISWNAVPFASSYNIYRSSTRGGADRLIAQQVDTGAASYSFTDTGTFISSTTAPGSTRMEMNSVGLQAFDNGGYETVRIDRATGNVTIQGEFGTAPAAEAGIHISSSKFSGIYGLATYPTIQFNNGSQGVSGNRQPQIFTDTTGNSNLYMWGGAGSTTRMGQVKLDAGRARIGIENAAGSNEIDGSRIDITFGAMEIAATIITMTGEVQASGAIQNNGSFQTSAGAFQFTSGDGSTWKVVNTGGLNVNGSAMVTNNLGFQGPTTGSFTANVNWNSASGNFRVNTSSRRFKDHIEAADIDIAKVLSLEPRSFERNDEVDADDNPVRTGHRYIGFIAEEAHDAGLDQWVVYDEEGPWSFAYDYWSVALQAVARDHEARIAQQADELSELRAAVAELRALLVQ